MSLKPNQPPVIKTLAAAHGGEVVVRKPLRGITFDGKDTVFKVNTRLKIGCQQTMNGMIEVAVGDEAFSVDSDPLNEKAEPVRLTELRPYQLVGTFADRHHDLKTFKDATAQVGCETELVSTTTFKVKSADPANDRKATVDFGQVLFILKLDSTSQMVSFMLSYGGKAIWQEKRATLEAKCVPTDTALSNIAKGRQGNVGKTTPPTSSSATLSPDSSFDDDTT